ncbi:MAG: response regulator [Kofleriaceae bacterium]
MPHRRARQEIELAAQVPLSRHFSRALLVPVAVLVAMALVLAWQIVRMRDAAKMVSHTNAVIAEAYEAMVAISAHEGALRGYLLTGDPADRSSVETSNQTDLLKGLRGVVADNPSQLERLEQIQADIEAWRGLAAEALEQPRLLARDEVAPRSARAQLMEQIRAQMREFSAVETELLTARTQSAASAERTATIAFVVLMGLAALSIAVFSRRQLAIVSESFQRLVAAEREARSKAIFEERVRSGQAAIGAAMLGQLTVEQVGARALAALIEHTGAAIGAAYVHRDGGLRRVAAHALPADAPTAFAEGEGLVGQVARDRAPRRITGVPTAHLRVASAPGATDPATIVVAPAVVDDELFAVVELGFLGDLDEIVDDLLHEAAPTLAVAVRSALQRARLAALHEETQRQGEELQTQHEELRVANEELTQQSEALLRAQQHQEQVQVELEEANASLEQQTSLLEEQKLGLLQTQRDLERHAAELALANRYKSEFLAKMSHELRTPLNSLLILARLLADNADGNLVAEQVQFAETIYGAGNDLLVLINDILDLAKIEAGRLSLRLAPVPLARVEEALQRTFTPLAAAKHLRFEIRRAPGVPETITTDEQRLLQVLRNLASNACKFTDAGQVTVTLTPAGDGGVAFAVNDTGIGIPADETDRVFEAFHQVDGGSARKHGGTGLGLSISRELATLLGGTLTLRSELGVGSTFTLEVPATAPAPVPSIEDVRPEEPSPRRRRDVRATPSARRLGPPMIEDDRAVDDERRVLLVIEDDPAFAMILRDLGRELGYRVLVASTAQDGIALASDHVPIGILLDIQLPDQLGLTVLEQLKRSPATRHIPVHVVSAVDHVQRSMELGAIGYLPKPASRAQLATAIQHIEQRTAGRIKRLLVVEDDADQARNIVELLAAADLDITTVDSVSAALAAVEAAPFDCMIVDLVLADGSGMVLLERLAADPTAQFPPIIVHTGQSLSEDDEHQLRRYASSIIVKGAHSTERLVDDVTLFLHQVEAEQPPERQRLLRQARDREARFVGRTVLIVEDDVRNVFALSSILEPKGLRLVVARNGREALTALEREPGIDLVLMDLMMPEMDGIEATRQIRTRPAWAKLPIIALTAKAMADDRERCLEAGASDYLTKPIDVDVLLSLLRVWMPR